MKRTDEPLMKRLAAVARQLDHVSHVGKREGLRAEAAMAHTFTVALGKVLAEPRQLQGLIAAWLLDSEAWLDELERGSWADMGPYHAAEQQHRDA